MVEVCSFLVLYLAGEVVNCCIPEIPETPCHVPEKWNDYALPVSGGVSNADVFVVKVLMMLPLNMPATEKLNPANGFLESFNVETVGRR